MYIHAMFGLVGEIIGKFAGQLVNAGYAIDIAINNGFQFISHLQC